VGTGSRARAKRSNCAAQADAYEARGEYQLIVEGDAAGRPGGASRRFLRLKAKLERKACSTLPETRPLPPYPRAIAIVTSAQAAALRDVADHSETALAGGDRRALPDPGAGACCGRRIRRGAGPLPAKRRDWR